MSAAATLPVEQQFATGHQGESLVLMVCQGWIWAGLYTAAPRESLLQLAASAAGAWGMRTTRCAWAARPSPSTVWPLKQHTAGSTGRACASGRSPPTTALRAARKELHA